MKRLSVTILAATLCSACRLYARSGGKAPTAPSRQSDITAQLHVSDWPLPITGGATAPDLHLAPDGRLLLSWISTQPGRRDAVQYAAYDSTHWQSAPKTIAVGTALFTNWADTPHIVATPDGALWVHWLQKSTDAQYAYDIVMSTSRDDGMHWSAPFSPHDDGTASEHGFVSMWPAAHDTLGLAWLDGRNTTATDPGKEHEGHGGGAMTLRAATYDPRMQRGNDTELDAMTCDCCQTDVAMTTQARCLSTAAATMARSATSSSPVSTARRGRLRTRSTTTSGRCPACPVNGPAVAARDDSAVVAWYTEAGEQPSLKLARSADAGATFAAPIEIDRGAAVMGRVDVAFDGRQVVLAWLREDASGQSLQLARYTPTCRNSCRSSKSRSCRAAAAPPASRNSPCATGIAHLVWTDIVDGRPQLHGAVLAR
jgi:hypothetical protein